MNELLQGNKIIDHDFKTTIKESNKRIQLFFRPREIKARHEHFKKEAESKLPLLPPQEPLIKVRQNLHPPFLDEAFGE